MYELIGKFINGTPWAITEQMLHEIDRIYLDRLDGKKADIPAIEAVLGKPLNNDRPAGFENVNGVAVIDVTGIISKRMNLFMQISGGVSIEKLTADFNAALEDPSVKSIILKIDSPGGTIDGVFELAEIIYNARDKKPSIALAYGTMASAAYLIGSAASRVYATDVAAVVGSIGVVYAHRDTSAQEKASGVVTTEIFRGKYKRIISSGPLTDEGRMSIEEKADYYYSLMIDAIARYRGVTSERVLTDMSTDVTDYFIGEQAQAAGLIDGIANINQAVQLALSQVQTPQAGYYLKSGGQTSGKERSMKDITTIEQLAATYPELVTAIREQAVAGVDLKAPVEAAAQAERTRILGLMETVFGAKAGEEFTSIVATGVTVEQLKAIRGTMPAGEQDKETTLVTQEKGKMLEAITAAGAGPVGGADGKQEDQKGYMALVNEYVATHKCSMTAALQAITKLHPEKHREYIKKANEGR